LDDDPGCNDAVSAVKGFSEELSTAGDHTFPIFRKGAGRGVILLHELPGLTPEAGEFAEWLARGFHIGFVLAMMLEASLLVPVAAQPSLPFFQPEGLDIDPEVLSFASSRKDTMSLLGLPFRE
jgi:hypothetical protein